MIIAICPIVAKFRNKQLSSNLPWSSDDETSISQHAVSKLILVKADISPYSINGGADSLISPRSNESSRWFISKMVDDVLGNSVFLFY